MQFFCPDLNQPKMTNSKPLSAENTAMQFGGIEKNDFINADGLEQRLALAVSDLAFEKFRISNNWRKLLYSNSLFLIRLFR